MVALGNEFQKKMKVCLVKEPIFSTLGLLNTSTHLLFFEVLGQTPSIMKTLEPRMDTGASSQALRKKCLMDSMVMF
jgi:hypothetical protein